MEEKMNKVTGLNYLRVHNPRRDKRKLENRINQFSKEELVKLISECGKAYLKEFNFLNDEKLVAKIPQEYKESFSELRKINFTQYLDNIEEAYSLLRKRAIELNVDLSKYPEKLEELTN